MPLIHSFQTTLDTSIRGNSEKNCGLNDFPCQSNGKGVNLTLVSKILRKEGEKSL